MKLKIDEYIEILPNKQQRIVQRDSFNAFIHYGLNTFTGAEWGDGKVSPSVFNPTEQNTDQWIEAIKSAGVKAVILTAKHHDGFCLWPTATTEYSVKNSPYKNGKGDVVREVSDSCRKYGLKFGVYLSPWDRNNKYYGTDSEKYNDIYIQQLTELLTNYGEIHFVWLDGACGAYMDGKDKQIYDFNRYFAKIRELAPNACISNCGPDIRWVGNEGGYARESEWNVVPQFAYDIQTIEKNSQQEDNAKFRKKGADVVYSDLGSRDFLSNYDEFMWYPAEVNVSIRPGWFYHKSQDRMIRSLNNLMNIYYTSIGGNSLFLLNIPPDTRGLIHENDAKRLQELGNAINSAFAHEAKVIRVIAPEAEGNNSAENVLTYAYNKETNETLSYYTPIEELQEYNITLQFDKKYNIDKVRIVENVSFSQRIEKYSIYVITDGNKKLVYSGTTVGYNRVALFKKAYEADGIMLTIQSCRHKPYIEFISAYETDGFLPKQPFMKKLKIKIRQKQYEQFINKENKKNK